MINLGIYSDIRLYRDGLSTVLDLNKEVKVVGQVENNMQFSDLLKSRHLDIALIDINHQRELSELSNIVKQNEKLKVIVFALPENDESYNWCLDLNVTGYLQKNASVDELFDAIDTVLNDRFYCPSSMALNLFKKSNNNKRQPATDTGINVGKATTNRLYEQLTKRELQILKLLVEGHPNKKIANLLAIQLSTVKNHVHNILVKIGAESRTQLAFLIRNSDTSKVNEPLDLDLRVVSN